jgi:peptidoglycan/xylan/chitin deacetylase (PgdA/CDA1 family)
MNNFFKIKFHIANFITNFLPEKKNNNIIIMYHDINSENLRSLFQVSEKNFFIQMNYLNNSNKNIVPINLNSNSNNNISISFDDGYIDNYYKAFPILLKFNLSATIFLTSSKIDKDPKFLTSKYIQEMSNFGIDFGVHGHNHISFTDLNYNDLKANIINSKKRIEDIVQKKVQIASYPNGKFNQKTKDIMQECGIKFGFCSKSITYDSNNKTFDAYSIPRVCIWSIDNNLSFKNKLKGKWDTLLQNSL